MDEAGSTKSASTRRKAELRAARANQREIEAQRALSDVRKVQQVEAEKTARLRALRLAKEADDLAASVPAKRRKSG